MFMTVKERKKILHYANIHSSLSPSPALSFTMVTQFFFLLHYSLFLLHYHLFLSLVSQVPSLENFPAPPPDSAWVFQSRDRTESMCRGRAPLVTLDIQVFLQLQNKHFHYINILWASDVDFAGKRSIVSLVRRERTYQKIPHLQVFCPKIYPWMRIQFKHVNYLLQVYSCTKHVQEACRAHTPPSSIPNPGAPAVNDALV